MAVRSSLATACRRSDIGDTVDCFRIDLPDLGAVVEVLHDTRFPLRAIRVPAGVAARQAGAGAFTSWRWVNVVTGLPESSSSRWCRSRWRSVRQAPECGPIRQAAAFRASPPAGRNPGKVRAPFDVPVGVAKAGVPRLAIVGIGLHQPPCVFDGGGSAGGMLRSHLQVEIPVTWLGDIRRRQALVRHRPDMPVPCQPGVHNAVFSPLEVNSSFKVCVQFPEGGPATDAATWTAMRETTAVTADVASMAKTRRVREVGAFCLPRSLLSAYPST